MLSEEICYKSERLNGIVTENEHKKPEKNDS